MSLLGKVWGHIKCVNKVIWGNSVLLGLNECHSLRTGHHATAGKEKHHLFSCREPQRLLLTSLFLTSSIWFLFIPGNGLECKSFTPVYKHFFSALSVSELLNILTVYILFVLSSLCQHKPPLEVNDLFEDIKDGVKLLALLEVLSGQRLVNTLFF